MTKPRKPRATAGKLLCVRCDHYAEDGSNYCAAHLPLTKIEKRKGVPYPRITTEATNAKLPKPKRKRPPRSAPPVTPDGPRPRQRRPFPKDWVDRYQAWKAKTDEYAMPKRVQCPRCEKLVPSAPHDIHTCYDAKALREAEARAIPCGEDVHRIKAWYEQPYTSPSPDTLPPVVWPTHDMLPVTEPYPWPLRLANWLDNAPTKARHTLAALLRRLAAKLAP